MSCHDFTRFFSIFPVFYFALGQIDKIHNRCISRVRYQGIHLAFQAGGLRYSIRPPFERLLPLPVGIRFDYKFICHIRCFMQRIDHFVVKHRQIPFDLLG